jgi:hypothetical protein
VFARLTAWDKETHKTADGREISAEYATEASAEAFLLRKVEVLGEPESVRDAGSSTEATWRMAPGQILSFEVGD